MRRPVAALAIAALGACTPRARPALDPAAVPQGTGWFCYQHEEKGADLGLCYRDRDTCAGKATADGNRTCSGVDQAFCIDANPGAGHDVRCLATEEDCEALARTSSTQGPTQCLASQ